MSSEARFDGSSGGLGVPVQAYSDFFSANVFSGRREVPLKSCGAWISRRSVLCPVFHDFHLSPFRRFLFSRSARVEFLFIAVNMFECNI